MSLFTESPYDAQFLNNLVCGKEKLTFLVGAGVSRNPPSNLPSAIEIVNDIIRFACPEEASKDILGHLQDFNLRFEMIMLKFRAAVDPLFHFIEFFEEIKQYNLIHFFLAEMIRAGHIVMTSNFDYLIEYALGTQEKNARAIITESDFTQCKDPEAAFASGLYLIYKLHGSRTNPFTGENTEKSVIATFDALGKDKGDDIFGVQEYKREVFTNASKDRSLVVVGYSGGDDFDIVPVIRKMQGLKQIIWIEHANIESPSIFKLQTSNEDKNLIQIINKTNSLDRELYVIANSLKIPIIKIKAHTLKLIESLDYKGENWLKKQDSQSLMNKPQTHISVFTWCSQHYPVLDSVTKNVFAADFYYSNNQPTKSMEWNNRAIKELENKPASRMLGIVYKNQAMISIQQRDNMKAKDCIEKAIKIHSELTDIPNIAQDNSVLANIYLNLGNPNKALEAIMKAAEIFDRIHDNHNLSNAFFTAGNIHRELGNIEKAIQMYENGYELSKKNGMLPGMAQNLQSLAGIYKTRGNQDKALEYFQKAYEVFLKMGTFGELPNILFQMASMYLGIGNAQYAKELLEKAHDAAKKVNNTPLMAIAAGQLGSIFQTRGDMASAMNYFEYAYNLNKDLNNPEALAGTLLLMAPLNAMIGKMEIAEQQTNQALEIHRTLNNSKAITSDLIKLAVLQLQMKKIDPAEDYITQALQLARQGGDQISSAEALFHLGNIQKFKGDRQHALEKYKEAYMIVEKMNNYSIMAIYLESIANLYQEVGQAEAAMNHFKNAFALHQKANSWIGMANVGLQVAYLQALVGNSSEALSNLEKSRNIYVKLGIAERIKMVDDLIAKINVKKG